MDSIGRFQFSEMARKIRNRLVAIQKTVDPTTGEETSSTIQNQLISNTDILDKLNSTMLGVYTDAMMRRPELFEDDRTIDVGQFVTRYAFPLGMLQFRELMWLRPGVIQTSPITPKPTDYIEMVCVDDEADWNEQTGRYSAPTWRRVGDNFSLNEIPQRPVPAGMIVRGVFLPSPLMDDLATPSPPPLTTFIRGPFPTLVQELIMLEVAKKLSAEKMGQEANSMDEELAMWRVRVDIAINNANVPKSVQFTSSSMIQSTYSGRRKGRWFGGRW